MRRLKYFLAFTLCVPALLALGPWACGCRGTQPAAPPARPMSTPTFTAATAGASRPDAAARPRASPRPIERPVRAIWVARFHYRYPDDVRTIVQNCAALGFNTVLWQVRGEGTVQYPSALEPWSEEFEYKDPGFDPLALAIDEAHKHGLRIEAWVNVLPGWKGKDPPPVRNQLYFTHPDWFLRDAAGQRQPLGEFYVILNPCLPEVRDYIAGVCGEIAARYDVDGVHLDYVRYAWETTRDARKRYPRDARTLALYKDETGRRPDESPRAWDDWRAAQLTRLVSEILATIRRHRPGISLTAAVKPDPDDAHRSYFQDAAGWLRGGLLDAVYPMAYTEKVSQVQADIAAYRRLVGGRLVVPGLGVYRHKTAEQTRAQLAACRQWGGDFAVFSYDALLPTHQDRFKNRKDPVDPQARVTRREVLAEFAEP